MLLQKLIRLSSIILFVLFAVCVMGQGNSKTDAFSELSIGDKIPASVWNKIPKKKTTELLILDFWSTGCTSCMEAFPHMEKLQKEFPEKLQVILMNPWENEATVKERMGKMNVGRLKNEMKPYAMSSSLPAITGDSVYKQLFPARSVPHHVWIDGKGTVLHITHGYNATPNHVQRILNGESFEMSLKKDLITEGFNAWDGILRKGHESVRPAFYSCFTRYHSGYGGGSANRRDSAAGTTMKVYVNNYITGLYQTAFGYGNRILLEVKNKSDYQYPKWLEDGDIMDEWNKRNIFTYEICVPFAEEKNVNKYMQADLNRFFGIEKGIEGLIEKRSFNCLILVKKKDGLLKTSGAENDSKWRDNFKSWTNQPFEYVVSALHQLEDMNAGRPFLDESGVDPKLKVDMQLTGDLKDVENVRKQVQPYGLDVIEGQRELEVLVIRDKK